MDQQEFAELLTSAQQGDEAAATSLVSRFEPQLRRFIRYRLANARMRNLVDSLDISQSVFARLFSGLAEGRLEVAGPAQLVKLLTTMAGNRIHDHIRKRLADKRAHVPAAGDPQKALDALPGETINIVDALANAELLDMMRAELSPEDRRLLDARLQGLAWNVIAQQVAEGLPQHHVPSTAEGLRKRLTRAIDDAASRLGIAVA